MNPLHEPADFVVKYLKGELTEKEQQALEQWLSQSDENRKNFEWYIDKRRLDEKLNALYDMNIPEMRDNIRAGIAEPGRKTKVIKIIWPRYLVAAAIISCISITSFFGYQYFLNTRVNHPMKLSGVAQVDHDRVPGHTGALLTLANGQVIVLDSAVTGNLAIQGNTRLSKKSDGQLIYEHEPGGGSSEKLLYNTLSTPKSRKINVILPDGSRVWLNAVSSIRYPTTFTGSERRVEVTGEAFFEVAKDARRPFIVHTGDPGGSEIVVLGTQFNVNAYLDETALVTTLLEGAVRFTHAGAGSPLKPGEEARLHDGVIMVRENINTEATVAWKNEMFNFVDADLRTIMRQVARWYDVDVRFETDIKTHYDCLLSRNLPVSKLFSVLEKTGGVHFKIEGKTVTVLP